MSYTDWKDKDEMVETCEHFIGYSLDTRAESFDKY